LGSERSPQGSTVVAEVRVPSLMQHRHDNEPITEDPVANCVREAVGYDLALDDLAGVVTKDGRSHVGQLRCSLDGCRDRVEESVAEPVFKLLVPGPRVQQVDVDEFVVPDAQAHPLRWARRRANRPWISSHVRVRASPDSSAAARAVSQPTTTR
jgi:hypothetical protein